MSNDNESAFSETEDTSLKRFLSGGRIYSMLAAAIICLLVFVPTFAAILNINGNIKKSKNAVSVSDIRFSDDLSGKYVTGQAYKFLAKLGYIAESEAAATDYYYILYLDIENEQVVTLVKASKLGDSEILDMIDAYLSFAENPDSGYRGNILKLEGRFLKMTKDESEIFTTGIAKTGVKGTRLDYTLKLTHFPTGKDTVVYWFIAVPFGAAAIVFLILFFYGCSLESKREEANRSPYPYLNKSKRSK